MFSLLSTALFFGRNGYRAQNGEDGRYFVAGAQGVKFIREGAKCNNLFARGTQRVLDSMDKLAKSDKVFNAVSKTVKVASDNVNPLIALLSAFNVITAEDKQTQFISESGNIIGMFATEGWMAKNLDKYLSKLPISKKWMPVVRGCAFVLGSITGSTLGHKLTSKLAYKLKDINENYKLQEANKFAYLKSTSAYTPKSLEYKA